MSTIEDLTRKRDSLRDKLKDAEAKLLNATIEACPVKVGDVVESRQFGEVRVTRIEPMSWWCNAFWLYGNIRKKNGDWGKAVRRVVSARVTIPEES